MRALVRMAAIAVAGAALHYAGLLNSLVILTLLAFPARRPRVVARRGRAG